MNMESKDKIVRNKDTGSAITRYIKSFFHALDGIKYATLKEHNMIIIIIAAMFAVSMGIIFKIDSYEWLSIIIIIALIAATELINSAIEAIVDLITPNYNTLAKIAKDTASGATLVLCIAAFIIALIIFIPKIIV